ncbi:uncharacterized protein DMAD_08762 [Drosophila madeirensis]|uniref:Uncharacterized protein n=1 Tax=Drosophila madeirensis TaxID=30013 RepID=A0AAU9F5M7_DROMD
MNKIKRKSEEKSNKKSNKTASFAATNDFVQGMPKKTARKQNISKSKKQLKVWQPEAKDLRKSSSGNVTMKGIQHNSFTILYPKEPKKVTLITPMQINGTGQRSKYDKYNMRRIPSAKVQPKKKN